MTPAHPTLETPQQSGVEMNLAELFRPRCLREAEEKFRLGVAKMTQAHDQMSQDSFAVEESSSRMNKAPGPRRPHRSIQPRVGSFVAGHGGGRFSSVGENPNETLTTASGGRHPSPVRRLVDHGWFSNG